MSTPEDSKDILIECLRVLCERTQRPFSKVRALSGIPNAQKLTPSLFIRAAAQLGLNTQLKQRSIQQISDVLLPAVLIMHDNHAIILTRQDEEGHYHGIDPLKSKYEQQLDTQTLEQNYAGYVIYLQNVEELDSRSDEFKLMQPHSWFWGTFLRYRQTYGQVLLAAVLINLFAIASSIFTMNVYDRVVPNHAFHTLWILSTGVTLVYLFDFILRNLRHHLIDLAGRKADILLSSKIFNHVMNISLQSKPHSSGAFANNLREFETLRELFTSSTMTLVVDLPFVLLFVVIIAAIGGSIAIPILVSIPLVFGVAISVEHYQRRAAQTSVMAASQKHAMLVEAISGLTTIKSLNAEGIMQRRWENLVSITTKTGTSARFFSNLILHVTMLVQQLVTVAMIIIGVYRINDGIMTLGSLIACTMLTGRALAPLAQLAGLVTRLEHGYMALRGLDKLMNLPSEHPLERKFLNHHDIRGDIQFDRVRFRYPHQKIYALDQVSFHVQPGMRVGIIGRIGSGKTTIGKLCISLYHPETGTIRMDGIDMQQIDPAILRNDIAYVGEESQLFFGTILDNLLLGSPHAKPETLQWATHVSGIDRYLKQHPLGYNLPIGERGEGLSSGQKQAVSLARTLIRNPKVLILDEPTSHMDSATELQCINELKGFLLGKTLILVTHKMSMLELVDYLIVMEQGKILASGPKQEVIANLNKAQKPGS